MDYCRYQDDPAGVWQQFLDSIDQRLNPDTETPEVIQGFLLAVRDCCLIQQTSGRIPAFVPEALARKAGLDPEELQRMQDKRRIRLLISDLSAPELDYRIRAAVDLAQWGKSACIAIPNLVGMVTNRNQQLAARQAATRTLGALGLGDTPQQDEIAMHLLTLLQDDLDEVELRRTAAETLGVMRTRQPELRQVLESDTPPLIVRQGAARALSQIGAASGDPIPMLIPMIQAGQVTAVVKAIPVWQEPLAEGVTLNLVAVPGGEFIMGSPPDEAGRDVYAYNFPETEGRDVEAQHRVGLSPFWMGQTPVTQAQWRFVAELPSINRDLDPDPSSFKGADRPVELVSWYDAMEFCARLSHHTGRDYRLPSEAQWEYACRAGTTTPFHLGGTIDTSWANYDGNYTYGDGGKGVYRQATTPVGSFGVVNAFGLADMHGTVWEWCLDHWHPDYEGAPTDGSAWVEGGDDRYRLVRGGSWVNYPPACRSAFRNRSSPVYRDNLIGFRVVCFSPCT